MAKDVSMEKCVSPEVLKERYKEVKHSTTAWPLVLETDISALRCGIR